MASNIRRLCFVDLNIDNLAFIQRLAREPPSELSKKIELYHTDFADMNILDKESFDIIIASRIFDYSLWNKTQPRVNEYAILKSWSNEVVRLLRSKPAGILITMDGQGHNVYVEEFSRRWLKEKDKIGKPFIVIWSRDKRIFRKKEE